MKTKLLCEAGYEQAMVGLALNKKKSPENMPIVAEKLAPKGGGHNNFLAQIAVWMEISAPAYWWAQFDRYQFKVMQSESKMHTLMKRPLRSEDFQEGVNPMAIDIVNEYIENKDFRAALLNLPHGFLQKRVVLTNYLTLANIFRQRNAHKLKIEWKKGFIDPVMNQLEHPELVSWTLKDGREKNETRNAL